MNYVPVSVLLSNGWHEAIMPDSRDLHAAFFSPVDDHSSAVEETTDWYFNHEAAANLPN